MSTAQSVESISGVGVKTAEQLRQVGIVTIGDLVRYFPKRHESFAGVVSIADLEPGKVTVFARCESVSTKTVRRGITVTTAVLADDTGKCKAVWFNQKYREQQLRQGEYFFTGTFEFKYNTFQLSMPRVEKQSIVEGSGEGLVPVYQAIRGLKSEALKKIITTLRPALAGLNEVLPSELIERHKLMPYGQAVEAMHFPEVASDVERARHRLAFDELFVLLMSSACNKKEHTQLHGWHIPFEADIVRDFVKQLPFQLTNAQRRVAWDILQDFEKKTPMNRMVQGDVGSGKTVVAGIAARLAAHAGFQTAIMAPTEILARQHAETMQKILGDTSGVTIGLLVGAVKGNARKELYARIADGSVDVIIGTQAIIQKAVTYHKLGFAVIDEQHRFGVEQRRTLLNKGQYMPHLLALTATPIPRSLALTVYGELDVSVINERPANRLPIITQLVSPISREATYQRVSEQIDRGRQVYVICPLIEDSESSQSESVEQQYKKLKNSVFGTRSIGVLHGKMKPAEKDDVMQRFKAREFDILISTTVVEVGVDVPNATVMIIESANTFGLSQLHQLRGRVGRGEHQSYCYLIMSDTKKPSQRLQEIEKSTDGFYLAEKDLEMRGAGEIYGKAQSGALDLEIAKLSDVEIISEAQQAAAEWSDRMTELEQYPHLVASIQRYQRLTTLN